LTTVVAVAVAMIATTLVVYVELLAGSAAVLVGGSQIHGWCFGGCSFWISKSILVELIHVPSNHHVLV